MVQLQLPLVLFFNQRLFHFQIKLSALTQTGRSFGLLVYQNRNLQIV